MSIKKKEVEIGAFYTASVSDHMTIVRITGVSPFGGWDARNVKTDRAVRVRSAARLRRRVASDGSPLTPDGKPDHRIIKHDIPAREGMFTLSCTCGFTPPRGQDPDDAMTMHLAAKGVGVAPQPVPTSKPPAEPGTILGGTGSVHQYTDGSIGFQVEDD